MTATEALTPFFLAVAPTGARKSPRDHPALPIDAAEIARCAAACAEAGAAMIHLHVRDREGRHSLDPETYRAAIAALRREVGDRLVIQVTTESAGVYDPARQMALVRDLRPEAVSLSLAEIAPGPAEESAAAEFLAWLEAERILPQYIVFSAKDLKRFDNLVDRGVVPEARRLLLFVLGRYSRGQLSDPTDLLPFLAANRAKHPWAVCAFGPREAACAVTAAGLDGHARVGFENNLHLPDGSLAPDNAALVAAVARGAVAIGRSLADAAAARAILAGA